jgi:hypothetical protein
VWACPLASTDLPFSCPDTQLRELGQQNQIRLHRWAGDISIRLITAVLKWPYELVQSFIAQIRFVLQYDAGFT